MSIRKAVPKLFVEDKLACRAYRSGLLPHAAGQREAAEQMWVRYSPLADTNFLSSIRVDFHPRFWEMYLAVALMDAGLEPIKASDAGPEFFVMNGGQRVWFEAIAPEAGNGQDAVQSWEVGVAGTVPIDAVVLRYTSAIRAKKVQYEESLKAGRISPEDSYVVSLNAANVPHAGFGSSPSYGSRSLYGVGDLTLLLDTSTYEVVDQFHAGRDSIRKANGASVYVSPFLSSEYATCSAALISTVALWNIPSPSGIDFEVYHNPLAKNALDSGLLSSFDQFHWVDSSDGGALRRSRSTR